MKSGALYWPVVSGGLLLLSCGQSPGFSLYNVGSRYTGGSQQKPSYTQQPGRIGFLAYRV